MKLFSMAMSVATLCVPLAGCGGSTSFGPSVATPVPTPTPLTFSGTYIGPMTATGFGLAALPCTGKTTIVQSGATVAFSDLTISDCPSIGLTTIPSVSATLSGLNAVGSGSYNSAGCGVVTSAWTGLFSGDARLLNLRVVVTQTETTSRCGGILQFLGEIVRS